MRWLVNYFRQAFCRHEWEYAEIWKKLHDGYRVIHEGMYVSVTCENCGYHKSYWKF